MTQRILDYYEHMDSDWILFYSANQISALYYYKHVDIAKLVSSVIPAFGF
jgi:hypothetical protein